ncbi:hypothetical protein HPP92_006315 [Vanilla planifolia]|uniref:Uncharacterized protein n=1 Tax=Vanilla planifolia TaxID=51239 RepID=A0A835RP19_VANPL|nr:hypothetical protein HPP92_006315 [Vanilla planifolia]
MCIYHVHDVGLPAPEDHSLHQPQGDRICCSKENWSFPVYCQSKGLHVLPRGGTDSWQRINHGIELQQQKMWVSLLEPSCASTQSIFGCLGSMQKPMTASRLVLNRALKLSQIPSRVLLHKGNTITHQPSQGYCYFSRRIASFHVPWKRGEERRGKDRVNDILSCFVEEGEEAMAFLVESCGEMVVSPESHKQVPAPFLTKTYTLVDDPSTNHIVSWEKTPPHLLCGDLQSLPETYFLITSSTTTSPASSGSSTLMVSGKSLQTGGSLPTSSSGKEGGICSVRSKEGRPIKSLNCTNINSTSAPTQRLILRKK